MEASASIPRKRRGKWSSFTLLEILLALSLIGSAGAILGVKLLSTMNAWRFEREVEEVFSTVRKAQALALTYQTDIAITFWATRSSFHMQSSSAEPFPRFLFDKSKRALPHIGRIAGSGGKEVQKLKLRIYGDGSIEPRTHLAFSPRGSLEPSHTLDVTTGFLIKTL